MKTAYDRLKIVYAENEIIVLGYSIGTGPASWLASQVQCKKLILLAPYYSLADEAKTLYPFLPRFILKYPILTYQYIQQVKAPVIIFHGDSDELLNHNSSIRLQKFFKAGDQLITLKGQQHNGIDENSDYQEALKEIL